MKRPHLVPREQVLRLRYALRKRIRIRRFGRVISPADVLTLTNGLMGLIAIGMVTGVVKLYEGPFIPGLSNVIPYLQDDVFLAATVLITIGLICDALDGTVARKWGGSRLGGDLDTLSDAVTFVTTPAIMVMAKYGAIMPFRSTLAAGLFFLMGVLRLARFNSNANESETKTFQGLPTPWAASLVVLTVLVGLRGAYAIPLVALLAFLMMSNVAYPKSRDRATKYGMFLLLGAAVSVVGSLMFFPESHSRIVRGAFVFVAFTVAVAPLLLMQRPRILRLPAPRRRT